MIVFRDIDIAAISRKFFCLRFHWQYLFVT